MSVISNNGTGSPMSIKSIFIQSPNTPPLLSKESSPVQPLTGVGSLSDQPVFIFTAPIQVIGIVPVFPCCVEIDATSTGIIAITNIACTATFNIADHFTNYGNFTVSPSDSAATIQSNINAILTGGITCIVNKINILQIIITLIAPTGTGASLNGSSIQISFVSGCGELVSDEGEWSGGEDSDCSCDCRQGAYAADTVPNDQDFELPVFASETCNDDFQNDQNAWIFAYPKGYDAIANGDFVLQMWLNGKGGFAWTNVATLDNTDYGIPYNNNFFTGGTSDQCENFNYQGFLLRWQEVLVHNGEGRYRFHVEAGGQFGYCFSSPPFCLKTFDCNKTNGTVKFEMDISGGTYGSVTDQGVTWSMCCQSSKSITKNDTVPIPWHDSIRFGGFFGREEYELQRDFIKYADGAINKVRDEAIKTFNLHTDFIPMWLQQRFMAYALQADKLYVSDYNLNNSNYNYKHFWVVCDSGYKPDYRNWSRYQMVKDLKFREGRQLIYRDRCC